MFCRGKQSILPPLWHCRRLALLYCCLVSAMAAPQADKRRKFFETTPPEICFADPCPEGLQTARMMAELPIDGSIPRHRCFTDTTRVEECCHFLKYTPLLMHIPKTGGKSLGYLMDYVFWQDWRNQYFYHHPPYSYQNMMQDPMLQSHIRAGCPLLLMTVLRNPVKRVVSEWYHYGQTQFVRKPPATQLSAPLFFEAHGYNISTGSSRRAMQIVIEFLRQHPHRQSPFFGGREIEIDTTSAEYNSSDEGIFFQELEKLQNIERYWDLMEAYVSHPVTSNLQVKFLLGYPMYSHVEVSAEDVTKLTQMMECFDHGGSCIKQMPLMLSGILERYNSTLERFSDHMGWKVEEQVDTRDTVQDNFIRKMTGRVQTSHIPPHIIDAIKANNKLDQMLYDWVDKKYY